MFEADGEADEFGEDAALAEVFVGELGVRGGGEDGEDVGEGAFGLRRRAVRDFARGGIDRELSGEKGPDPAGLDSDIENPELWAAQQLRVRTIDAANNTVVSMEEMPGSNVYVTRDQIGRLLYNCVIFGKRILVVTPDDPEAPEEVRENVKASW